MPRHLPIVQPGSDSLPAAEGPPPFVNVGVVGLGLIGGSLAFACRQAWPTSLVIGVDHPEVVEEAIARHAIDVAAEDLFILSEADLVVLAAPVEQNLRLLGELPAILKDSAVVTDVGSTKRTMAETAHRAAPGLTFVGGHPLAGAARAGIEHASGRIFVGRPWIFTPHDERGDAAAGRLASFVEALGARAHVMTPEAHDHLVAYLSHLPQLVASGLMQVVGEEVGEPGLALAGRGLVDTTRLASSPASVWADICATNADEIGPAIDRAIALLQRLRLGLTDGRTVADVFDSAAEWRGRLPGVDV